MFRGRLVCQKWTKASPWEELATNNEIMVHAIRISPPAFSLLKNCWNISTPFFALLI
jgi:hypothetical protein